jgi:hypothetical protein
MTPVLLWHVVRRKATIHLKQYEPGFGALTAELIEMEY